MEAYTEFARVYDTFMDETPYEEWCIRIRELLVQEQITDGLVLELGCGTGTLTQLLARAGYDMIGVDNSMEMLEEAGRKKEKAGMDILYLMQDMQAFELYGTVRAIVCACDGINYLTDREELVNCFRLVNNYLDTNGVFIFDFNTVHKYRDVIGDTVIAENRENCSFIWENYYDEEQQMNEYDLTLFIQQKDSELYRKEVETHYQRAYELAEIKKCLEEAGLLFVAAFDDYTEIPAGEDSERIVVVAREQYVEGKVYTR